MALSIAMITVDSADPVPLAQWWVHQLDGTVVAQHGEDFIVVETGRGGPRVAFQRVEEPTPGKNRIHIDFEDANVEAAVDRLLFAGATKIADREIPGGGFSWVTMADPQGNLFCISAAHDED